MNNPWDAPFNQINFKRFSIPTSSKEKISPKGLSNIAETTKRLSAPGHPPLRPDDNAAWLLRHPKSKKGEPEIPFFTLS